MTPLHRAMLVAMVKAEIKHQAANGPEDSADNAYMVALRAVLRSLEED